MSLRRAVEYHFKSKLDPVFDNTKYSVVESLRQEERPLPVVVITGGDSRPAFEYGDVHGNYIVDVDVVILSSLDDDTVDAHNDAVQNCMRKLRETKTRKETQVQYLYLYDIYFSGIQQENADRKMGTVIKTQVVCNYFTP